MQEVREQEQRLVLEVEQDDRYSTQGQMVRVQQLLVQAEQAEQAERDSS